MRERETRVSERERDKCVGGESERERLLWERKTTVWMRMNERNCKRERDKSKCEREKVWEIQEGVSVRERECVWVRVKWERQDCEWEREREKSDKYGWKWQKVWERVWEREKRDKYGWKWQKVRERKRDPSIPVGAISTRPHCGVRQPLTGGVMCGAQHCSLLPVTFYIHSPTPSLHPTVNIWCRPILIFHQFCSVYNFFSSALQSYRMCSSPYYSIARIPQAFILKNKHSEETGGGKHTLWGRVI